MQSKASTINHESRSNRCLVVAMLKGLGSSGIMRVDPKIGLIVFIFICASVVTSPCRMSSAWCLKV